MTKTKDPKSPVTPAESNTDPGQTEDKNELTQDQLITLTTQQSDEIARLKEENRNLQSSLDSTKSQLDERTGTVAELKTDARRNLAERLVFQRLVSGHADTKDLKSTEDFAALAETYASRSIDSLQDAVRDSLPDVYATIDKISEGGTRLLRDSEPVEDPVGRHGQPDKKTTDVSGSEVSDEDLKQL